MFKPKFKKALLYLNHEGVSDLFSSQPEYQFVFDHTEASIDVLKSIDDLILRQKKIHFLPPLNDLFSIGRHIYRRGSLLDPFLHVYATAVVMALQHKIEKFRSLTEPNKVFSYRLIEGSDTEWFDPSILAWQRLEALTSALEWQQSPHEFFLCTLFPLRRAY